MKILFLNQFFWPDSSATSQLLTDLVRGLAARGHDVTVVCADSGYAPRAADAAPDARIVRVKALPFVRGGAGRVFSYVSFYALALMRALTLPKSGVVVSLTTPPLISLVGTLVKAIRGSRHLIWEMDMYPDVAVDLNYVRAGGVVERITGALADFARRHSDGVLALGECMKSRLIARGIAAEQIYIAENWADAKAIQPEQRPACSASLVLLYSGNLGLAHDLDTILAAAAQLRDDSRFNFIFAGGGGRRKDLAAFSSQHNLKSIKLLPYASREDLGISLSLGDIGLVTQQNACCGSVVPSKMYGIMAAGRPILFIGPRGSTVASTIERFQCGWQIDCGDIDGLQALLVHLAGSPEEIEMAGNRARRALLDHFDLARGVERIANIIELTHAPLASSQRSEGRISHGRSTT